MQKIRIEDKEYTAPSGWSELSAEHLLYLGMVDSLRKPADVSIYFLLAKLFKVPKDIFKKLHKSQITQLKATLNWLMEPNTVEKWLIKSIDVFGLKLLGPQNMLADMTAEEFMYCEGAYERWLDTESPEHLDTLFAVLYRKKMLFYSKRSAFDAERLPKQEQTAKKVKTYIKKAVAINYAGCRNLIIKRHPDVWKKRDDHTEKPAAPGKKGYTSWAGIILDLAGDKFGTYQQTIKTEIWLVLADLNKKAKEAAREGKP